MTCKQIEIWIAKHYGVTKNLIVPNVSYGMGLHECDILILSKSGYATEIEIKVSRADLLKDSQKTHLHMHQKISRLYFAMPESMQKDISLVPDRAGVILVRSDGRLIFNRLPKENLRYKFSCEEMYKLARLGNLRYWFARIKNESIVAV